MHAPASPRNVTALLCAAACALLLLAGAARAETFGGLGRVGETTISGGSGLNHGEVNAREGLDLASNTKNGDIYIASETSESAKHIVRVQTFSATGAFLAENKITTPAVAGGLTVDPTGGAHGEGRVYLLLDEERPEQNAKPQHELEVKENEAVKLEEKIATEKGKGHSVTVLEEELRQLEKEIVAKEAEAIVFDGGFKAAERLYAFSAEIASQKLSGQEVLVKSLEGESETPGASLLSPSGIAVDPVTHDVVILAQQDDSKVKLEEDFHAVVERVHDNGTIGPRYADEGNCLDEANGVAGEPACLAKPRPEEPDSPIVTPEGKVYVEEENEVWEVPDPQGTAGEPYKLVSVVPKLVFALGASQSLLNFGDEGAANQMSFAAGGPHEGTIDVSATVAGEGNEDAVLELGYDAGAVSERGWTGGQSKLGGQKDCYIPVFTGSALVSAGTGQNVLAFVASPSDQKAELFAFGPSASAEACGHPTLSPPAVRIGEESEATKVEAGKTVQLHAALAGANAMGTTWKLKYLGTGGGEEEIQSGYQFQEPTLEHAFTRTGEYEISAVTSTDNLGTPTLHATAPRTLTVTAAAPAVKLAANPSRLLPPGKVTFEASVTDPNEEKPHLKYSWTFGDGTSATEEESASKQSLVRKAEHTYTACGGNRCVASLTVEDTVTKTSKTVTATVELQTETKGTEPPPSNNNGNNNSGGGPSVTGSSSTGSTQSTGVLSYRASLAGSSFPVSGSGAVSLKVSCPPGAGTCSGTITLKTLTAVSAKSGKKPKKSILTLGSASFAVVAGHTATVTIHLSSKARSLLGRSHTLKAQATVASHGSTGSPSTTSAVVTLKAASSKKKH